MTFDALGLIKPLLKALQADNITTPTPIQAQAIPALLEGRNLMGIAQTGTGKTAAFALPVMQRLYENKDQAGNKGVRALILAPTRELAGQISDNIAAYNRHLGLRHATVFGGVRLPPQIRALQRGVDILVATPGRLMDLMNQGHVRLTRTNVLVLDEADRMLDMGFIRDVRKIAATMPADRQTLLFSATMSKEIEALSRELTEDPVRVEVAQRNVTVDRIDQKVYHIPQAGKRNLLTTLLRDDDFKRVIVFTRTKHGANRVSEQLDKAGIPSDALHGNKSQSARQQALRRFKSGQARVLVATDIAARGIDVSDVSHVINYELPNEPESYVHRVGRTARAGTAGVALSFCAPDEAAYLLDIEKLTKKRLEMVHDEALGTLDGLPDRIQKPKGHRRGGGGGGGAGRNGGGGNANRGRGGNRPRQNGASSGGERTGGEYKGGQRNGEGRKSEGFKGNGQNHKPKGNRNRSRNRSGGRPNRNAA
jgi:ATP-dependent RNA helicase RhlE